MSKLLICLECGEIFNLAVYEKRCMCGETSGRYIDPLNAEISGNCKAIGFANDSFREAYRMQKIEDEAQKDTDSCCAGVEFTAFFIPETAKSIKRI